MKRAKPSGSGDLTGLCAGLRALAGPFAAPRHAQFRDGHDAGVPGRVSSRGRGGGVIRIRARQDRRGIALLMVITTVMFLTVLVTDISFGARLRFLTAVHDRDEAKAYWIAATGVNVYRLILTADKSLAGNEMLKQYLGGMTIWEMVPMINTGLMRMLSAGGGELDEEEVDAFEENGEVSEEVAEESRDKSSTRFGNRNFLDFDGDFSATIRGEDCRINVNQLATVTTGTLQESPIGLQIYGLLSGEDNEAFLRDRSLERWDLIGNLADWVDSDNFVSSGKGGYEDDFYNQLRNPYLAKNTKFDTLTEIRMVEGWQDEVYERFGPQLTIYGSGKLNINCAEDDAIRALLRGCTTGMTDTDLDNLIALKNEYETLASFTSGKAFATWLTDNAVTLTCDLASQVSTKTTMFTLDSTGTVGDSTAQITAVVDYSSSSEGSVVYWRVD